jgi:hypothetical protein
MQLSAKGCLINSTKRCHRSFKVRELCHTSSSPLRFSREPSVASFILARGAGLAAERSSEPFEGEFTRFWLWAEPTAWGA